MKCKPQRDMDLDNLDDAIGSLVNAQLKLGKELLGVISTGAAMVMDSVTGLEMPKGSGCCDIPEPCWMPRSMGELCTNLGWGHTAELCLTITNEDFLPHAYTIGATGDGSALVTANIPTFTLGPKETKKVTVKLKAPDKKGTDNRDPSCCDDDCVMPVIWVNGCQKHYLRWKVCFVEKCKPVCHHVCVSDEPNYVLNWYDHFHVMRDCPTPHRPNG